MADIERAKECSALVIAVIMLFDNMPDGALTTPEVERMEQLINQIVTINERVVYAMSVGEDTVALTEWNKGLPIIQEAKEVLEMAYARSTGILN